MLAFARTTNLGKCTAKTRLTAGFSFGGLLASSVMAPLAYARARLRRSKFGPDEFVASLLPPYRANLRLIASPAVCQLSRAAA
jgi:hypothetical protein